MPEDREQKEFHDSLVQTVPEKRYYIQLTRGRKFLKTICEELLRQFGLRAQLASPRQAWAELADNFGMLDPTYPWPGYTPTPPAEATPWELQQQRELRIDLSIGWFEEFLAQPGQHSIDTVLWLACRLGLLAELALSAPSDFQIHELYDAAHPKS